MDEENETMNAGQTVVGGVTPLDPSSPYELEQAENVRLREALSTIIGLCDEVKERANRALYPKPPAPERGDHVADDFDGGLGGRTTTDGKPPVPGYEHASAPGPIDPATGQHTAYWVLSEEERKKGFVRPLRRSYIHVGKKPTYPLRPLTEVELERYGKYGYAFFEESPEGTPDEKRVSRFWTQAELDKKPCNQATKMGLALCETYARDPHFYGATFCATCGTHFPVSEFVWAEDGKAVGS